MAHFLFFCFPPINIRSMIHLLKTRLSLRSLKIQKKKKKKKKNEKTTLQLGAESGIFPCRGAFRAEPGIFPCGGARRLLSQK